MKTFSKNPTHVSGEGPTRVASSLNGVQILQMSCLLPKGAKYCQKSCLLINIVPTHHPSTRLAQASVTSCLSMMFITCTMSKVKTMMSSRIRDPSPLQIGVPSSSSPSHQSKPQHPQGVCDIIKGSR
jgi:hypothetical protein